MTTLHMGHVNRYTRDTAIYILSLVILFFKSHHIIIPHIMEQDIDIMEEIFNF